MGNRMTATPTPKSMVVQGGANTLENTCHTTPPLKGGRGWWSVHHLFGVGWGNDLVPMPPFQSGYETGWLTCAFALCGRTPGRVDARLWHRAEEFIFNNDSFSVATWSWRFNLTDAINSVNRAWNNCIGSDQFAVLKSLPLIADGSVIPTNSSRIAANNFICIYRGFRAFKLEIIAKAAENLTLADCKFFFCLFGEKPKEGVHAEQKADTSPKQSYKYDCPSFKKECLHFATPVFLEAFA